MSRAEPIRRGLAFLLLALLALAANAGCQSDEAKFESLRERAREHRAAGRNDEALIELRNALRLDPQDAETNYQIAELLQAKEKYLDALFFFEEAYRLDPQSDDAALGIARLRAFEDPQGAREILEEVLERSPGSAVARVQSSALAFVERDLDRALAEVLTAVELEPENPAGWHQLGRVRQASIQMRQNVQEKPDDELFRQALHAFEKVQELGTEPVLSRAARWEVAKVLAAWPGHEQEALAAHRRLLEEARADGSVEALESVAAGLIQFGQAIDDRQIQSEAMESLVEVQPERVSAWRILAQLAASDGRPVAPIYERMIEVRPEDATIQLEYARFLSRTEGAEAAQAHLARAMENADDPLVLLGGMLEFQLRVGQVDEASATLEKMIERGPGDPRTSLAQASVALQQGRAQEAVDLLQAAVSVHERPDAYRVLASALLRTGDAKGALQAIDRAIELYPNYNAAAVLLRVDVLRALGDWAAVRTDLGRMQLRGLPLSPAHRGVLAVALYETGRKQAGRRILENLIEQGGGVPRPGTAMLFARREGSDQPERARSLLAASLERYPDNLGLIDQLVRLELRQGDAESALARLDAAREAGQDAPPLELLRAQVLVAAGRADEGERAAQRAFERMPNSTVAMDYLVSLYLARNKLDAAIRSFEEAEEAGVLDASGKALLGRLYLRADRIPEATKSLESALAGGVAQGVVMNDLAYLLALDGQDLDRALALALEARELRPADPVTADTLGFVMLKRGLPGPAEANFREAVRLAEQRDAPRPGYHYRLGLALQELGRAAEAAEAFEAALSLEESFPEADAARAGLEEARAAAANAS